MRVDPADLTPGLNYVDDTGPGITRRLLRGHWAYFAPDGERITDRDEIDRLNAIGMPPAYMSIAGSARRSGRPSSRRSAIDDKGRKQYRYHHRCSGRASGSRQI